MAVINPLMTRHRTIITQDLQILKSIVIRALLINSPTFKISIYNRGIDLTNGSYADTSTSCLVSATYFPLSIYSSAYQAGYYHSSSPVPGSKNLVITISSISSTEIKGTFSGELASLNDTTNIAHVTNGKFYLRITRHS